MWGISLIAGTRCSHGGLGLPLNYHETAPLAYLTTILSNADTLTELYKNHGMSDHGLVYLIEQFLKTPESEDDFRIVEGFPAKQDLLKSLSRLKVLKNLHPSTSLVDVSQFKQLSQSYASSALSNDNVKLITERLLSVANKAQFLSQQQDGAMYPVIVPPTYCRWTFTALQFSVYIRIRIFSMDPDPVGYPTTSMYPCLDTELLFFQCLACKSRNACVKYEHLQSCPGGTLNISRHNDLIELLLQQFNSVNIHARGEPGPVSDATRKKTDIRAMGFNLQPKHIDWAVISPNAQTYAQSASTHYCTVCSKGQICLQNGKTCCYTRSGRRIIRSLHHGINRSFSSNGFAGCVGSLYCSRGGKSTNA